MTQVMVSMCKLQDKGKGSYTEISTLLSEYLVIQVQEDLYRIKFTICVACIDTLEWKCILISFDN